MTGTACPPCPAASQVAASLAAHPNYAAHIQAPRVSADGHSALVTFQVPGNVTNIGQAVSTLQHPVAGVQAAILRELEIRAWRTTGTGRRNSARPRTSAAAGNKPWSARHDFRQAALAAELTRQLERRRLAAEIDRYLAELRAVLQDVGEQQLAGAPE